MTTVSIHQPGYFPWLGLVDKIARSDVFVALDNVQFNRRAFQHRTLYSTKAGAQYLGLSVHAKGHQQSGQTIAETRLADPSLTDKHFETLRHRYGRQPGWALLEPKLAALLCHEWQDLGSLALATLQLTLETFGIAVRLVRASALDVPGAKDDLMLGLTLAAGGTRYLSGRGAESYMDDSKFQRAGIEVVYQNFVHPAYRQSHGGAFVPGCFALEWPIEEPATAAADFRAGLTRNRPGPSRSELGSDDERNRFTA